MLPDKILAQFKLENGDNIGVPIDLPSNVSVSVLQDLYVTLSNIDEPYPCSFYVKGKEVIDSLYDTLQINNFEAEQILDIICQPHAIFKVRSVTRCTSTLSGHLEPIISASFSPDGKYLASGSGDKTVRLWDLNTETPQYVCKGHAHWVLCVAWSPDGLKLASACKSGQIILWNPKNGKQLGKTLLGHKQWINCICWEPLHLNSPCRRLASASKDGDVRIWDTVIGQVMFVLSGHTQSVTCIKWSSLGLLYSGSQDRTVKGVLCRTLEGHGHWVNILALNTDYLIRTGPFEPSEMEYFTSCSNAEELLVSGSDDFTLFLWLPDKDKKPKGSDLIKKFCNFVLARMTGHQQIINDVKFSPDGRLLASASYDKSIKLWDGKSGKFIISFRGHVQEVYQISWSSDSRLLVSGSADSTLKVWNIQKKCLEFDLPGHADEVYVVDWSPDGQRVVSGGKDKMLKM